MVMFSLESESGSRLLIVPSALRCALSSSYGLRTWPFGAIERVPTFAAL